MSEENETMRQKVWVAYSEDTSVIGVRYDAAEAQQLVTDYVTKRDDSDGLTEWRYGAHGLWAAKAKKWGAQFFVERFHFDMPKVPDMSDVRPENAMEGTA